MWFIKGSCLTFCITLPNLDLFSELFHGSIQCLLPDKPIILSQTALFLLICTDNDKFCKEENVIFHKTWVLALLLTKWHLKCSYFAQMKTANWERLRSSELRCYSPIHTSSRTQCWWDHWLIESVFITPDLRHLRTVHTTGTQLSTSLCMQCWTMFIT